MALTTVQKQMDYMGLAHDDMARLGLSIVCQTGGAVTGADVIVYATAGVTTMQLAETGGATYILTLTDVDKDTLAELATYIHANCAGWTVRVQGDGTADSSDLLYTGIILDCFEVWVNLEYADTSMLSSHIDAASELIEKWCRRTFLSATYEEWYDGNATDVLLLRQRPVTRVNRVAVNRVEAFHVQCSGAPNAGSARVEMHGTSPKTLQVAWVAGGLETSAARLFTATESIQDLVDFVNGETYWTAMVGPGSTMANRDAGIMPQQGAYYCLDTNAYIYMPDEALTTWQSDTADEGAGRIRRAAGWDFGFQNIFVSYVAGLDAVPAPVEQVCWQVVAEAYYAAHRESGLTWARIGGYSFTARKGEDLLAAHLATLGPYRHHS